MRRTLQPIIHVTNPDNKTSSCRTWSRVALWTTLVIALGAWYLRPRAPVEPPFVPRVNPERGWRYRRPPVPTPQPVVEVPADLWRIQIEIRPEDMDKLRGYRWDGWRGQQPQERPEVLAVVREGGVTFTNVALHLKGSAGSFRPIDDKPALTLSFSKHAAGQQFHGFTKISLNNSVQDSSFLTEIVCRELFNAAGVPAPRADHATVLINGRDLGLYVLTEGWGKPFLRRYFKNVSGNLYDGGFVQDINADLAVNSGDNPSDRSALDRLIDAAAEPDPLQRAERLAKSLDMDRFFSFMAMEIMTCHWDGYSLNRNNYRVFHDRSTDRIVFMPHGLDQMFGVMRSTPDASIDPSMRGLVAQAVLSTPGGRERLLARIATLRTNVFLEEKLTNRVQELSHHIRPTIAAYGQEYAEEHDRSVAYLCQRIMDRARSISEQLSAPRNPVAFDEKGVFPLTDWKPNMPSRRQGVIRFDSGEQDGRRILRTIAGAGGGVGSWRTRVLLEPGNYRFEGSV
ncbi:MAG TPA: CotH kinase family protein, partial [Candidatus Nitrosotalea sp.]|nr:CotH kinase family protein [Candidatus Nitrosotalea sp.]